MQAVFRSAHKFINLLIKDMQKHGGRWSVTTQKKTEFFNVRLRRLINTSKIWPLLKCQSPLSLMTYVDYDMQKHGGSVRNYSA